MDWLLDRKLDKQQTNPQKKSDFERCQKQSQKETLTSELLSEIWKNYQRGLTYFSNESLFSLIGELTEGMTRITETLFELIEDDINKLRQKVLGKDILKHGQLFKAQKQNIQILMQQKIFQELSIQKCQDKEINKKFIQTSLDINLSSDSRQTIAWKVSIDRCSQYFGIGIGEYINGLNSSAWLIYSNGHFAVPSDRIHYKKGDGFAFGVGDTVIVQFNKKLSKLKFLLQRTGQQFSLGIDLTGPNGPNQYINLYSCVKIIYYGSYIDLLKSSNRAHWRLYCPKTIQKENQIKSIQ